MDAFTPVEAKKRDVRALPICFAVLTFLFWAMMEVGLASGFGVVWLICVGATFCYLKGVPAKDNSAAATLFLAGAVVFTPIYALTEWFGLAITVFLIQGICWLFWIALATGHGGSQQRLSDLLTATGALLIASLTGLFEYAEGISTYNTHRREQKAQEKPNQRSFPWGIVGGILLALPVLGILIPILSSADAAFSDMMWSIGDVFWNMVDAVFESVGTLFLSLFLAAITFYPVTAALFSMGKAPGKRESATKEVFPGSLLVGFYGSISLLCLIYLLAQLSYLFNGFMGVLPEGLTAAEYARRGFFEIFAFSLLSLGLVGIGVMLAKRDRFASVFDGFLYFLCGFSLVLISTAFAKMILYVRLYGLTLKRLTVTAILLLLAVIFVTIIIGRIFKSFRSLPVVLTAALLLFGILGFADPHRIVAEYNVMAWEKGWLQTVDVELLGDLSDAAIPALIRVSESENAEYAQKAEKRLEAIYMDKCVEYKVDMGAALPFGDGILNYRLSEHIANRELNEIRYRLTADEEAGI